MAAIVVVVVVVLALLFLGFLGIHSIGGLKLPGGGTPGAGALQTFSQAYSVANRSAQGQSTGPWLLVAAGAFVGPSISSFNWSGSSTDTACAGRSAPALQSGPTSDIGSGESPNWIFDFVSDSGLQIMSVAVVSGISTIVYVGATADGCLGGGTIGHLPSPSSLEDSPAAMAALGSDLSSFLTNYPGGAAELVLAGQGGSIGSPSGTGAWFLLVSPCATNISSLGAGAAAPGDPAFLGGVNATTQTVIDDLASAGLGYCESPGTLGASLVLGAGVLGAVGPTGFSYVFPITSASSGITFGDFHPVYVAGLFVVPGQPPVTPSDLSLDAENALGQSVAAYDFSTTSWITGGSAPVTSSDRLVLSSTVEILGNALVLVGQAPMTGEVSSNIG